MKVISNINPRLGAIETKTDQLQTGYDELEKSVGYHVKDITSNKSDIERLNGIIKDQQKERLIGDNRKIRRKLDSLS